MAPDVKEPQTPSGDKYQRYNYVITEGGDIIVAVWKPKIGSRTVEMDDVFDDCEKPDLTAREKYTHPENVMVNFYPENPTDDTHKTKVCEDTVKVEGELKIEGEVEVKGRDVLDNLTNHFMLAQAKGTINNEYTEEWQDATVAYAGEIIVDVVACEYTINNGSGTYSPTGAPHLEAVAEKFYKVLDTAPTYQVYQGPRKNLKGKSLQFPETWCR